MAHTVTKPLVRSDDVRALRFRHRRINLSGNFPAGGEQITAAECGLSRIYAVVPLNPLVGPVDAVTGELPKIDIDSGRKFFRLRLIEDAAGAAGVTIGQVKASAEAYVASSFLDVLVIGE
jgi:hypothetical protein